MRCAAGQQLDHAEVREAAKGEQNLLPFLREALRAHCTVGELCETLREEWGMYDAVRSRL